MTADPFDVVSDKLGGIDKGMARCPAHEDRAPSLSVTRSNDGNVLLHCHAGCTLDQIVAAAGLKTADLFPPRPSTNGHKRIVATYDYTNEHGELLFQVVRYNPKTFKQRRPDGNGGWIWNLKGVRIVPYRLPELIEAIGSGRTVFIAEGEKDVDALRAVGESATCGPMGAGKWSKVNQPGAVEFGIQMRMERALAGVHVMIVADKDAAGYNHARDVARSLVDCPDPYKRPTSVTVVEAAIGKDAADHLAAGRTVDDFAVIARSNPAPNEMPLSDWLGIEAPCSGTAFTSGTRSTCDVPDVPDVPPPTPDELGALLNDVTTFIKRFMVMTDHQTDAVTLFAAHTHAIEAFDVCAYLFITSAVRRSGKTLLEELLEQLCLRGRSTTNISPAAVYRMVDEVKPTLLFDEVDNIFVKGRGGDPTKTDLIGLINAGYRRGKPAYRMGGPNMRTLESFDPFGPKVLAGIGGCLPDTTEDRCIQIRLERKDRTRKVERYRIRLHETPARELGQRLGTIAALADTLRDCWPALPDELDDRAQDIWEPLLSIADVAGGDWPQRARAAALVLNDLRADSTEPAGIDLLADIRRLFAAGDRMFSTTLVEKLNAMEETPWSGWNSGAGFRTFDLARLLRDFNVKSKQIRIGNESKKGYLSEDFADAWARYVDANEAPGDSSETGETSETPLARHVSDVSDVSAHQPNEEEPCEQLHLSTAPSATDASDNNDSTTSSTTTESSAPDASTDTTSTTRPTETAAPEPASPTPSDSGPDGTPCPLCPGTLDERGFCSEPDCAGF